ARISRDRFESGCGANRAWRVSPTAFASRSSVSKPRSATSTTATACERRAALGAGAAAAGEAEGVATLAESAATQRGIAEHLADDREDLAGAEIEAAVEGLERREDLRAGQIRVAERTRLHTVAVDEPDTVQPAALERLAVERGPRVGR